MAKKHDVGLIGRVKEYMASGGLSAGALGREAGYSATTVTRWLDEKYSGDIESVEAAMADVLAGAASREQAAPRMKLVKTKAAEQIAAVLRSVRQANQVAVITGPAGVGKSSGAQLYCAENTSAIMVTVNSCQREARDLLNLIFQTMDHRGYSHTECRWDYVTRKLGMSNRLIVIDNAHKLDRQGLACVFDLHDAAGVPIGLLANPEIIGRIRANDQWYSRVGRDAVIEIGRDAEPLARRMVNFYVQDAPAKLHEQALDVIRRRGHGRCLAKQLTLMLDLKAGDPSYAWAEAFLEAGEVMVSRPDGRGER